MTMTMATPESDFFICLSIHEASCDAQGFLPLYEERLTLIKASSKREATDKAQHMVKAATHSYKNADGQTIAWSCKRIVNVTEIIDSSLADGAEIYGRYFRDLDAYDRLESALKDSI
jgi:hypothetical protein